MEKNIIFRAVVEVLGRPKEHVEISLKDYIKNLKENEKYEVINENFAETKKQEEQDLWTSFAEVEVKTEKINDLTNFCFDFMPSMIEILEPAKLTLSDVDISLFLNDLQAKLHNVDMIAKQIRIENDSLKLNMSALMKNYLTVLLSQKSLTSKQLNKLTGVKIDKLEDYLDQLIDTNVVEMKEGIYSLKKK